MEKTTQNRLAVINRKNISTYGVGAVAGAALMSSNANAAFDPSTALTGASAEGNIETIGLWMLGTVVVIWGIRKVIGFFSR